MPNRDWKLLANKREVIRLRTAMMQVETVVKMVKPGFSVASIPAKRRNKSTPGSGAPL